MTRLSHIPRARDFMIENTVFIGKSPCESPQGFLIPGLCRHELESYTHTTKKALGTLGLFSWCNIVDAFQTAATLAQEDYKLKHLAEQFRLADNLI